MLKQTLARFGIVALTVMAMTVVPAIAFAAAPPSNDSWRSATAIGGLAYSNTEDPSGAHSGGEPQPSCQGSGATVWYAFTPSSSNTLQADTFNSPNDYDTVLAVYTRDGHAWNEVGCDDDTGSGTLSEVQFTPEVGVTYYFQIGACCNQHTRLTGPLGLRFNLDQT